MAKNSKNLQRVQDMLDGNYKHKIQSGYEGETVHREIGDTWTDSDGLDVAIKCCSGYCSKRFKTSFQKN